MLTNIQPQPPKTRRCIRLNRKPSLFLARLPKLSRRSKNLCSLSLPEIFNFARHQPRMGLRAVVSPPRKHKSRRKPAKLCQSPRRNHRLARSVTMGRMRAQLLKIKTSLSPGSPMSRTPRSRKQMRSLPRRPMVPSQHRLQVVRAQSPRRLVVQRKTSRRMRRSPSQPMALVAALGAAPRRLRFHVRPSYQLSLWMQRFISPLYPYPLCLNGSPVIL